MTEKIEAAKLATQIVIALLGQKGGIGGIAAAAKHSGADKSVPDVLLAFDVIRTHIQDSLGAQ